MNDFSLQLSKSTEELRKLILDNPDLPIVILVGEDAIGSDYYYTYATKISYHIDEYLDHKDYDECVITDRDELEERLEDYYCDEPECENLQDAEFDEFIQQKMQEYEPYWKKAIFIYADN